MKKLHDICCIAGAISEPQVVAQAWALLLGGLGVSYVLDRWAGHETPTLFILAVFGSLISYIYSAPPLKLKQSGWIGNYALGSSYIALPWWAGQVLFPFSRIRKLAFCAAAAWLSNHRGELKAAADDSCRANLHLLQALFGNLSLDVMVLTVLYSIAGLGIAIVNDFKSIEGDR